MFGMKETLAKKVFRYTHLKLHRIQDLRTLKNGYMCVSGQRYVTDMRSVRRLRAMMEMEESELLHVSEDGTTVCEKYMEPVC